MWQTEVNPEKIWEDATVAHLTVLQQSHMTIANHKQHVLRFVPFKGILHGTETYYHVTLGNGSYIYI
jgi:hypothetical protein